MNKDNIKKKIKNVFVKVNNNLKDIKKIIQNKLVLKKKNNDKKNNKLSYKDLTIKDIENELYREKYKSKYLKVLMSTFYTLIIVASFAALIATLIMPVLQISGTSMLPTLKEGEIVVALKNKNINTGDVIAFYHGNKILVKRVIAKSGNWVRINEEGQVYINEVLLDEAYIKEKNFGQVDIEFPYQVEEGSYFVLGDDRINSIDSRMEIIGCVKEENIIGKVIFRVWPIKKIGLVK